MKKFPKPWFRPSRNTWYVTLNGHQINLGQDKTTAFERYKQLLAQPQPVRASTQSLAVLIDAFLDWTQTHRAPDTYEWYRYRLQRFIDQHPDLRTDELRPFHVQQWVDSYDISQTSRRNYVRSIKRCMAWAVAQGYLTQSPLQHLEVPSSEAKDVLITVDEYRQLLSFIPDGPFRDLVVVTWETGCRPQESLRVEVRHVDMPHQRWVFPRTESKGKKAPRIVYLTDAAMTITERLVGQASSGRLFRNASGTPWTTDAVNCAFDRLRLRMGQAEMRRRHEQLDDEAIRAHTTKLKATRTVKGRLVKKTDADLRLEAKRKLLAARAKELVPRYSLYALRHSWATRALKSGTDALTVAILMGHSDPSTLAKVYQHLSHDPVHLLEKAKAAAG